MKETDLFEPVKQYFIDHGCEVFSEVLAYGGKRADMVIRDKNIISVIELKTTLSLDLLKQCYEWKGHAHYIYACVPALKKNNSINRYSKRCLLNDGIGLLTIKFYDDWEVELLNRDFPERCNIAETRTMIQPHLNRRIDIRWNEKLTEKHKLTLPGGTKGGGFITPYSEMMERVRKVIERKKEVEIEELACINLVKEHYLHPQKGLLQALIKYESDWCEIFKNPEGKKTYVRIKH